MTARRDMTDTQFRAALKRRGFRRTPYGVAISDTVEIGWTLARLPQGNKACVLNRRETLRRAIEEAAKPPKPIPVAIDWSKNTPEEKKLCRAIAKRAVDVALSNNYDSVLMNVCACNISCPLKLQELLDADDFNFAQDVGGIYRHLNRETGELENCFLPRFAKPE